MNSKHIKSFLIVIFCLMSKVQTLTAQVYSSQERNLLTAQLSDDEKKVIRKSFLKSSVQLIFHYDDCKWRGVTADEVNDAFSREDGNGFDSTYLSRIQRGFESEVMRFVKMGTDGKSPFALHIYIKNVNMYAGIKAEGALFYQKGQENIVLSKMNLDVEDNRWNRFSILFVENGEKLGEIINKNLQKLSRQLKVQGTYYRKTYPPSQRDVDNFTLDN